MIRLEIDIGQALKGVLLVGLLADMFYFKIPELPVNRTSTILI